MSAQLPFSRLVVGAMKLRGLGLRELCRQARLDPSFLSKVLTGKRSPPSEEEVLRRMAAVLETDAVALFVAAGRIPDEWKSLHNNPDLLRRVDALANSRSTQAPAPSQVRAPSKVLAPRASAPLPYVRKPFNEELL